MSQNSPETIELKQQHVEYLDRMVPKYQLSDRSKAVRILIDSAMSNQQEEATIFEEVRCLYC